MGRCTRVIVNRVQRPNPYNVNVTVFDVDGPKAVGSAGVNVAVSECWPGGSVWTSMAKPEDTGRGGPRLVVPSLSWTVPAASAGATSTKEITKFTKGIGSTVSVVVVAVTPGVGVGVGVSVGVGTGLEVGTGVEVGTGLEV